MPSNHISTIIIFISDFSPVFFTISDRYLTGIMCDALVDVHRIVIDLIYNIDSKFTNP